MSEEDIKILEEQWGDTDNLINDLICDYKELQSKIDKAIEYIKENSHKIEWGDIEEDNESIDINDDITDTEFIESLLELLGDKE